MNIALAINNLKIGGAETLAVALMKAWLAAGHNVFLIVGDAVCVYPEVDTLPLRGRVVVGRGWRAVWQIARCFKKNKIDVCFSHLERANLSSALAGRLIGTPVWCVVHSINIYINGSDKFKRASRVYRYCAAGMIAISDSVRIYLRELGIPEKKIHLIPNGVNITELRYKYHYCPGKDLHLLFIGRVEPVKGLDYLLQALSQIDCEEIDWRLTVVGDGSARPDLERQAQTAGIGERITWAGSSLEPWGYLGDSRILCLTSRREGLPMTLLEGMSIGVPMLVSRVGFLPDLVDKSCGRLCNPGAIDEIVRMLRYFASIDKGELAAMSQAAVQRAEPYGIEVCAARYLELTE